MYLLPIFFTLISFFFTFFLGRYINNFYSGLLTSFFLFISLLISLFIFYEVALCGSTNIYNCGQWITVSTLEVTWSFFYDPLTAIMLIVILSISTCAHFYSIEYMLSDPNQIKFMSYLSLFTFFMLLLVTSSNLVILFIGWEGVGICSYLLINFWHTRIGANKSAIMAMFVNKVGDISLLLSFSIIYLLLHTLDFSILSLSITSTYYLPLLNIDMNTTSFLYFTGFFFIIGAVGKSAQAGLHTWLPEATEGPTPVSSLIHAATMVTAGIFLISRTNVLFQIMNDLLIIIIALGSITAFLGSTIGIFQSDIKKIIAYSTCSQLGYMFLSSGLLGYNFSIYHLTNHAFFKALLFLVAGYIIHAISNEQDIRKLGGLLFILPFSYIGVTLGSLSLLGFPFFSGFFSKEKIIELFYSFYISDNIIGYSLNYLFFFQTLTNVAVIFTVLYSIKLMVYVYFYSYQNNKTTLLNVHYSSIFTIIPLFFLGILSLISGYFLEDMMVGFSTNIWNSSIFFYKSINFSNINYFEFNSLSSKLPIYSIFYFILLFIYLFYSNLNILYHIKIYSIWLHSIYTIINKKYLFINKNIFYPIIDFFFKFSYSSMYSFFDKGIIEWFGPLGIVSLLNKTLLNNLKLQTGLIYHYFGLMVISIILFIFLILYLSNL